MNQHVIVVLAFILVPVSLFAMIFGIVYLNKRENLAMIERGMNPRLNLPRNSGFNTFTLTWGLLLVGAGTGLFLAYMLDMLVFRSLSVGNDNPALYFSLIAICGGGGLFTAYRIEKQDAMKLEERSNNTKETEE